jgi:hypothetical protein
LLTGGGIDFWTDEWCDPPHCDSLQIPPTLSCLLTSKVSDFTMNHSWPIPDIVTQRFPAITNLVQHVTIPIYGDKDQTGLEVWELWKSNLQGSISFQG